MKTKLITALCALAVLSMSANTASADSGDDLKVAADTLVVRPVCLAATIVGSGLFVICFSLHLRCYAAIMSTSYRVSYSSVRTYAR